MGRCWGGGSARMGVWLEQQGSLQEPLETIRSRSCVCRYSALSRKSEARIGCMSIL